MSESASSPAAPKRRGLFAFLFKSVLGWAVLVLLLLAGLVLALPTLAGGWVRGAAEGFVREHHQGRLTVGAVSLAWFSEQRVTDAVLLDPEGREVARASVTLPSLLALLRSGGTKLGTVWIQASADLVADDAGVTNLARALAPRDASTHTGDEQDADGGATSSSSGLDMLAKLELELEFVVQRLRWSDAETRRLGKAFELTNLVLRASAQPGAPITVKADAKVAGDAPGSFAIDAKVDGPITPGAAWPFGTIEATGRVKGFSSALVDGLAGQKGRLKELLGPAFDLEFRAKDVTREAGELVLTLASPATKLELSARIEQGRIRASGERFLDASIALPRAYLDAFVVPHLPPGSKLDFGVRPEPWSVRIDAFDARIPSFAELDPARLAPVLEDATLRCFASMASPIGFENAETTKAFGRACALEGTTVEVELAPKAAPRIAVRSKLVASAQSPLALTAASKDLWNALATGSAPHADVDLELVDVPVAALDAALGTEGKLARGLGETLRVAVKAVDAGLDRGSLDVRVKAPRFELDAPLAFGRGKLGSADGQAVRVRLDAPAGWIEGWLVGLLPEGVELASDDGHVAITAERVLVPLPGETDSLADLRAARADVKVELPSVRASTPATSAAKVPMRLARGLVDVKLDEGGRAVVVASLGLETGATGAVSSRIVLEDAWSMLPKDGKLAPRPFEVMFDATDVSSALLDAFAGTESRVRDALGATVDAHVEAKGGDLANASVSLAVESPRIEAEFRARVEANVLRCTGGEEGLEVRFTPDREFARRELAQYLPAGAELALAEGDVDLALRDVELALPDFASGARVDVLALLEGLSAKARATLPTASWKDASTVAAGLTVALEGVELAVHVAPKEPVEVELGSTVAAGAERGTLRASASLSDAWFALRAKPMPPIDATVELAGLSTRLLDAFAGTDGALAQLLGSKLDVNAILAGVTPERGSVRLGVRSETLRFAFDGVLADGAVSTAAGKAVELSIQLPKGWIEERIAPGLPAGARLSVPTDVAPLTLRVARLHAPLPKIQSATPAAPGDRTRPVANESASSLALVAGMELDLELAVPELVYADAKTDAAGRPVVIRGWKVESKLAPTSQPFARVTAAIESEPPGTLRADVRALDALQVLGEASGVDRFRVACDVEADGVPTALVDALAGQGGLLVEALGSRVQVRVKSESLSMKSGALVADLTSDLHHVHVEGAMLDGAFRVTKQSGIDAKVGLGPVMNEKVVGRLVPMLVNLKKPDGSAPSILAVDGMSFPLDGNLRELDADVRIDLGEVTYALLPGLDTYFGSAVELKPTKLPALRVPIVKGVARYDALKLRIAGTECAFSGSFDLVDLSLKLDTQIPLKVLGKKVNKELDKVREYVSPDLAVPIEIRGAWNKPKVSIADGFVKKLVEDAAKKGLGDLLEGLFDKKKKKD